MNAKAQKLPFAPVYDADSRVLILGSFPSLSSVEVGFYYGDSSNRFWDIWAKCSKSDKNSPYDKDILPEPNSKKWI